MPRSDPGPHRRPVDWRAWLALAWAAWFGLLYGAMLLERRAPWAQSLVHRSRAADSHPVR